MNRLRNVGRWLTDWRNGATLVASVLVALLVVVVVDSIQGRRAESARVDRVIDEQAITLGELQRRGVRIDELADDLARAQSSRDAVTEELRALREMLVDQGVVEPRPQQPVAVPQTPPVPSAPAVSAGPSPRPAETNPPTPATPSPTPTPPCRVTVLGLCPLG